MITPYARSTPVVKMVHAFMHTRVHTHTHTRMHAHTHRHTHTHAYTNKDVHTQTHTHTHAHTYTQWFHNDSRKFQWMISHNVRTCSTLQASLAEECKMWECNFQKRSGDLDLHRWWSQPRTGADGQGQASRDREPRAAPATARLA